MLLPRRSALALPEGGAVMRAAALLMVVSLGCNNGGSAPLPTCSGPDDCVPYLTPGPCGFVACDRLGVIGEPDVPDVPHGCYVRIEPAGTPCDANMACDSAGVCQ